MVVGLVVIRSGAADATIVREDGGREEEARHAKGLLRGLPVRRRFSLVVVRSRYLGQIQPTSNIHIHVNMLLTPLSFALVGN